ncbi:hypothetical protein PAESOLCIP111_05283 [Paenibacillus solanacearum]|uniref:Xylose isomerase-like TIM barrel domain-containing protein n=1 Tax=Paenibacillus solanacearum TaxID=2048548 RepID=A0A916K5W0_9BACL|nr:sugar phosphate isomerase/epimerase family protein [Paenibacillus solanacearum]CAG7646967.1 hypothetical protein PAESOLCIP111_05283 [Paenibacillus solanacearum]
MSPREMNPLGIFNHVYRNYSLQDMAATVSSLGLHHLHLEPRIPQILPPGERISSAWARSVKRELDRYDLNVAALCGYCNLVHHDPEAREVGLRTFEQLIEVCHDFGTPYIATETGGLNPQFPNLDYPANHTEEGWEQLLIVLDRLVNKCKAHGVKLLIEGCVKYTVATTEEALRVLGRYGEEHIGFVLDPCNYFRNEDLAAPTAVLDDVFRTIAPHAPIAHAKDVVYTDKGIETPKAGDGFMDYKAYAQLLRRHTPDIPLIIEHLKPADVPGVIELIRQAFAEGKDQAG